jgi:hypothetical protein
MLLIIVYEYLKCIHNLFFLVDRPTSPGSKIQIEMDTTSSHSSLSFGTYSYQYTRGINVQQVKIRLSYTCKTCFYETSFVCVLLLQIFCMKIAYMFVMKHSV